MAGSNPHRSDIAQIRVVSLFRRYLLWRAGMTEADARWVAGNGNEQGSFLASWEWQEARYKALKASRGRCECCNRSRHDLPAGEYLCVDHIKPRVSHPWLALSLKNLQVLDTACNRGKGRWDTTDWRHKDRPHKH